MALSSIHTHLMEQLNLNPLCVSLSLFELSKTVFSQGTSHWLSPQPFQIKNILASRRDAVTEHVLQPLTPVHMA